jgi:hypothetical protein
MVDFCRLNPQKHHHLNCGSARNITYSLPPLPKPQWSHTSSTKWQVKPLSCFSMGGGSENFIMSFPELQSLLDMMRRNSGNNMIDNSQCMIMLRKKWSDWSISQWWWEVHPASNECMVILGYDHLELINIFINVSSLWIMELSQH